MGTEELRRRYEELLPKYGQLENEAKFILEKALQQKGIKIHSPIQSRIKDFDSFAEKAARKQCKEPFEEIDDVCGLRVICLFVSDLRRIGKAIKDSFAVVAEDNKIEGLDVSSFGYSAVHFVATMKESYRGPRYDDIAGLKFEVQVATIAMHAWASVSHYLDYKTEVDVPSELKRDFYALSGLFYVADTHFEMFFKAREQSREQVAEEFSKGKPAPDTEINLDTLTAYLKQRFPDREHADPPFVSELLGELALAKHASIADIEQAIDRGWEAFIALEEFECGKGVHFYTDVGVIRGLFELVYYPEYVKRFERPNPPTEFLALVKR